MICSVINQKGGVGETTLATNIASQAMLEGLSVCIVDLALTLKVTLSV